VHGTEDRRLSGLASAVLVAATLGIGCSSPAEQELCDGTSRETIVNGSPSESYFGLTVAQTRAIVELTEPAESGGASCSGTFVRDDWIITAAHCLGIEAGGVVPSGGQGTSTLVPLLESIASPLEDVALLRVDPATFAGAAPAPMGVLDPSDPELVAGTLVELAGYGTTETGEAHELRFVVEPIHEVDPSSIIVTGSGASGACDGDSGGPLLARGEDGSVRIAGTLSAGSPYCNDKDRYTRLDTLAGWVRDVAGSEPSGASQASSRSGSRIRCR
jgi:hypothetical protein